jgi:phage tail P2-like protein
MTSLLPANATDLERAVEALAVALLQIDVPLATLWDPARCPAATLPNLAWALSVDDWDKDWSVARKRAVVAASVEIHRRKGTPWAVLRALEVLGYQSAQLIEHTGAALYDGSLPRDGTRTCAQSDHWAEYRLILDTPISIGQAAQVRGVLETVAPAGCHLKALDYTQALSLYDGRVPRTGTYTRGVA